MDLFDASLIERAANEQPLAARMRPRTLEEFIGQESIVGKGRLLYRAIKADQLSSLIFYGPPGTGKTTLAAVIANTTKSNFITVNAVLSGVKEIRAAIAEAQERRKLYNQRTILFVDEVHRWNKAQQDALLPWVENGTIILIGATTENPFFEVNRALLSRSRIFQLKTLGSDDLYKVVHLALTDPLRGYGKYTINIDEDALAHLVNIANGDARTLLNALELAVETTPEHFPPVDGEIINIDLKVAEESIQRRIVLYDKEGDYHFDTISAFIKSLRGSDPDAALYWLAKMVFAGEDPHFIFRRMLIFACEDVGLADPQAIIEIGALAAAFDRVGLPEGQFHLTQAVLYLSTAPKSNTSLSYFDALETVKKEQPVEVPTHLRDSNRDKEGMGHGVGYLYPHAYRDHWVMQQYLPQGLQGKVFYRPAEIGYEAVIKETVERRREMQLAFLLEQQDSSPEILTFSPPDKNRDRWLTRTMGKMNSQLIGLRDSLFQKLTIPRHALALDLCGETGIFTLELLRQAPEGGIWSLVTKNSIAADMVKDLAGHLQIIDTPHTITGELNDLPELLTKDYKDIPSAFDLIVGKNILAKQADKYDKLLLYNTLLRDGGTLALIEAVPRQGQRLSAFLDPGELDTDLLTKLQIGEEALFADDSNASVNWEESHLAALYEKAGFTNTQLIKEEWKIEKKLLKEDLTTWFNPGGSAYARYLLQHMREHEFELVKQCVIKQLVNKQVVWKTIYLFVIAKKIHAQ